LILTKQHNNNNNSLPSYVSSNFIERSGSGRGRGRAAQGYQVILEIIALTILVSFLTKHHNNNSLSDSLLPYQW
jgi:hypothetical protein